MKGKVVILIIVVSVVTSALFFGNKHNAAKEDIDLLQSSLATISKTVPTGTTIGYLSYPNDLELFGKTRYALAPTNVSLLDDNSRLDTVLSIHKVGNSDSLLQAFLSNRTIIYQQADSNYQYYISITP